MSDEPYPKRLRFREEVRLPLSEAVEVLRDEADSYGHLVAEDPDATVSVYGVVSNLMEAVEQRIYDLANPDDDEGDEIE